MFIDVVIVNWNSADQADACVRALLRHGRGEIASIKVVDNASSDGSAERIVRHTLVEVTKEASNLGFGKACNRGAAKGEAPYILFINPDCLVNEASLADALAFLTGENGRIYDVAGIRLIDGNGLIQRHCARLPGPRIMIGEASGLSRLAPALFPPLIMVDFDHRSDADVDHVIGAFYLVRRSAFQRVGGFDQAYFMYMEDLDLSARIAAAGGRIRYLATPSAQHLGGGSSRQVLGRRLGYSMIARATFSTQHFHGAGKAAVYASIALLEPLLRFVRALGARETGALAHVAEGVGLFWRWLLSGRKGVPA